MQKTKSVFTFLLVLPAILWMLGNPMSFHTLKVEKVAKSQSSKETKAPQKQVISEQSTYHSSPTPTFDFPTDFEFKQLFTIHFLVIKEPVKSLFTFARSKIFTILFTQYISTLAP